MSNTKTTIHLNGKRYDATTGKIIEHAGAAKVSQPKSSGRNMDGFIRNPKVIQSQAKPAHSPAPSSSIQRTPSPHAHRKPQPTKTLMRHAVKKPGTTHTKSAIGGVSSSLNTVLTPEVIAKQRTKRAHQIGMSPLISRFGNSSPATSTVTKKTAHVPVQPAPIHVSPVHSATSTTHHSQAASTHHNRIVTALEKANSHEQPKLKRTKAHHKVAKKLGVSSRLVSLGAGSLAALLLAGFIAYQNIPNIAMRVAAGRAGFSASLPGYQPSGFALNGPIQASPGIVTLNFKSNADDRGFQITERPSQWNSESLLNNFVIAERRPYQTYQDNGKTIYMYDDANATWVDGGVWYQVEGNSSLNSEQLLRIANSL